jgi:hypothetical protein
MNMKLTWLLMINNLVEFVNLSLKDEINLITVFEKEDIYES